MTLVSRQSTWRWLGAGCLAVTLAACGGGSSSSSGGNAASNLGSASGTVVDGIVINGVVRAYSLAEATDTVWDSDHLPLVGEGLTGDDGTYTLAFTAPVTGALLVEVTADDDTRVKCASSACGDVGFGDTYVPTNLALRSVVMAESGTTALRVPVTPLTSLVAAEVQKSNEVTAKSIFENNSVVQKTFGLSLPPNEVLPVDITDPEVDADDDQIQHSIINAVAESDATALQLKLTNPADDEGVFADALTRVKEAVPSDSAIKETTNTVTGESACDEVCEPDEYVEPEPPVEPDPELPLEAAALIGSWKLMAFNGATNVQPVIVNFLPNGKFVTGVIHPANDECGDGVEYGDYWLDGSNSLNLTFLLDTLLDQDCGLVGDDPGGSIKRVLSVSATHLSLEGDDDETGTEQLDFERIVNDGFRGSWVVYHHDASGEWFPGEPASTVLTFLASGHYMAAEFNNDGEDADSINGVEYGRYSLNNGIISVTEVTRDTNGSSGLSDIYEENGSIEMALSGMTLTMPGEGDFRAVRVENYEN